MKRVGDRWADEWVGECFLAEIIEYNAEVAHHSHWVEKFVTIAIIAIVIVCVLTP